MPTIIAESKQANPVMADLSAAIDKLIDERDEYKKAYERNVELALQKSVEFENMRRRNESLRVMLAQACQEMESRFDVYKELPSVEIATQYTVWARYLQINYGRDHYGRVDMIQDWIEKQ